ncbi:MAG TPA: hypothetical protein VLH56_19360 [Dissulfurispiraceae bacterium]|nr:hypothetical protein [Dissulfurispiraceae bacterium]
MGKSQSLYGGAVELEFHERLGRNTHCYTVGSEIKPSVTKILGIIAKPWLVPWALNEYEAGLLLAFKPGVAYDELQLRKIIAECKNIHKTKSRDAADLGTDTHDWIEQHIKSQLNQDMPPDMPINETMQLTCQAFLNWEARNKPQWLSSERYIYSANHQYVGTLDFEAIIDGYLVVGDIKTSKAIYDEYWLQLAGYRMARNEELLFLNNRAPLIERTMIVRLGKVPTAAGLEFEVESHDESRLGDDTEAFVAALNLYNGLAKVSKGK